MSIGEAFFAGSRHNLIVLHLEHIIPPISYKIENRLAFIYAKSVGRDRDTMDPKFMDTPISR